DLQTEGPIACGDCAVTSRLLPPGGSFDYVWDDTGLESASMPASCYAFPPFSMTCSKRVQAELVGYSVQVNGYGACSGSCSCTPDGECYGLASGSQAIANPAMISYPAQNEVTVTFPPCALPCP